MMQIYSSVVPDNNGNQIPKVQVPSKSDVLNVNFSKFKLNPICINSRFNNHYKNDEHFAAIAAQFLGTVLPKITGHTFQQVCEGAREGQILHFHTIDEEHQKLVYNILKEYNFPDATINQMMEGNSLFEFVATLGHTYPARVVCHKVDNVLNFLFFDTNHHIYLNEKYVRESLFYEECPAYKNNSCKYMPQDCFAFGYLDENKLSESFGYSTSPADND